MLSLIKLNINIMSAVVLNVTVVTDAILHVFILSDVILIPMPTVSIYFMKLFSIRVQL